MSNKEMGTKRILSCKYASERSAAGGANGKIKAPTLGDMTGQ